jgi:hypothetical protein
MLKKNFSHIFVPAGIPLGPTASTDDHCNKTVDIYVDIQSPPVTRFNRYRPLTCWYRFKSIRGNLKEWVLRLSFKKFKVGTLINSTHCDGGYLQVRVISNLHNEMHKVSRERNEKNSFSSLFILLK